MLELVYIIQIRNHEFSTLTDSGCVGAGSNVSVTSGFGSIEFMRANIQDEKLIIIETILLLLCFSIRYAIYVLH